MNKVSVLCIMNKRNLFRRKKSGSSHIRFSLRNMSFMLKMNIVLFVMLFHQKIMDLLSQQFIAESDKGHLFHI